MTKMILPDLQQIHTSKTVRANLPIYSTSGKCATANVMWSVDTGTTAVHRAGSLQSIASCILFTTWWIWIK